MQELDNTNVFVKYLPSEMKKRELSNLFSPFGGIVSAKVMVDPHSGSSLGYGYVKIVGKE
jgi:RNA recognition motif-containing protein